MNNVIELLKTAKADNNDEQMIKLMEEALYLSDKHGIKVPINLRISTLKKLGKTDNEILQYLITIILLP